MSRSRFVRNVSSNWVRMAWSIGWGVVLVPVFLSHLGKQEYGVWLLINSIVGYYGMFDVGVHGAVIRHTARALGREDPAGVNVVVNTAFWIQAAMGTVAVAVAAIVALVVPRIEGFAAAEHPDAGLLFLLAGSATALAFAGSTFRGVLVAAERFDLSNGIRIGMSFLQNVAYIVALTQGAGLVALASILLAVTILEKPVAALIAFRTMPDLRFSPRLFDRAQVREIFGYGMHTFLVNIGTRFRFFSDSIVIGSFLNASSITLFNLGSRPLQYELRGMRAISGVLKPGFSRSEAADESGRGIARMLLLGTRLTAILATAGCLVLALAGDRILRLWLGEELPTSYLVMLILVPAYWVEMALAPAGAAVLATKSYRISSACAIGEGVANLLLSLLLVGPYGLTGVAVGTAVPMIAVRLFIQPWAACRTAGVALGPFLARVFMPVLPALAVGSAAGYGLRRAMPGPGLLDGAVLVCGILAVYGGVSFLTMRVMDDELLPKVLRRRTPKGPGSASGRTS